MKDKTIMPRMFTLKITNTTKKFHIDVYHEKIKVAECGWQGTNFTYNDRHYAVVGPYDGWTDNKFQVCELIPVSELTS